MDNKTTELPFMSILDEFAKKRHKIIEEGNIYLNYIYSNLGRAPKRKYSFEQIIQKFNKLRIVKGKNEIQIAGLTKDGKNVIILKTRNTSLYPFFVKVVKLFISITLFEKSETQK